MQLLTSDNVAFRGSAVIFAGQLATKLSELHANMPLDEADLEEVRRETVVMNGVVPCPPRTS